MWLLTIVGHIHGQNHFTFALEQKKTYTFGRDRSCDIRFDDKAVKPKAGILEVDDWDPTNPKTPPEARLKLEPLKSGKDHDYYSLNPYDESIGSLDKDEYERKKLDTTKSNAKNVVILEDGVGIEFNADNWMFARWIDVNLQHEGMKDEPDEVREKLSRYCIAYTEAFDVKKRPTLVLSSTYQNNVTGNYAVSYGIRILKPNYLHYLLAAADASWKQVADSQDSFSMHDETSPDFAPDLNPALPTSRKDVRLWLPDPTRQTLFKGWKILALRAKIGIPEKKWMTAMGAEYDDLDVLTRPLLSSKDFLDRITKWLQSVDATGSRDRAIIGVFSNQLQAAAKTMNWKGIVEDACESVGITLVQGSLCWGSVARGSVQGYLDHQASKAVMVSEEPNPGLRKSRSPEKRQNVALPDPTPQALKIPSTFPDESAALAQLGQSSTERSAPRKSPEVEAAAPSVPVRKPLKRRAGKPTNFDIYGIRQEDPPSGGSTPNDSQEPAPRQETLQLPSAAQTPADTQSIVPSGPPKVNRLKRRAGQPSQAAYGIFEETRETPISKTEETPQAIRDLYEATKRGEVPALKRSRVVSTDSAADEDSLSSAVAPASPPSEGSKGRKQVNVIVENWDEDVEMGEEREDEDFVQKTMRLKAENRKAGRTQSVQEERDRGNMPPPSLPPPGNRRQRSPSDMEMVESVKRQRIASPPKIAPAKSKKATKAETEKKSNEPTTDPAFLLAVHKSRSKKAMDEMDKEFNNLKIPKSALRGKNQQLQQQDIDRMNIPPDYNLLDGLEEMRGNFIQVVKKDLYRKDGGLNTVERIEDGKPNFKKFKKKEIIRSRPVHLVLVGQNSSMEDDAMAMGEPYWPSASSKSKSQMTQTQALNGEDEDSLPLLPRARNRRLLAQDDDEMDDQPMASTSRRRQHETQATSSLAPPRATRKTRAASIASEADSTTSTAPSARGKAAAGKAGTKAGRGKQTPILLEDSDEEDSGVAFTATGSGARSGGRGRTTTTEPSASVSASASASASSRGRLGQPSSSVTVGRKKLLVVDDDDDGEIVFKAAAKKRRIG